MATNNKRTGNPIIPFIILAIGFAFTGCASTNADSSINALQNDLTSLKNKVSSLEEDLSITNTKNKDLEAKIQTLEGLVNGLRLNNH